MSQFDKKAVKRWRRDVWRVFEKQGFKPAEIMAALVMAAVAAFGTDLSVLSEITGHSADYVRVVLKRLRKQRVLSGATLRTAWDDDNAGGLATALDAGVAAGIFTRGVDPKRSAAQRKRAASTRAYGPRRKSTAVAPGAVFTPAMKKANPLYGLPEWDAVSPTAQHGGSRRLHVLGSQRRLSHA